MLAAWFSAKSTVPVVRTNDARVPGMRNSPCVTRICPDSRGSRGVPLIGSASLRNSTVAMLLRTANSWTTSVRSSSALPSVGYSSQNGLAGALLTPMVWIRSVSSKLRR